MHKTEKNRNNADENKKLYIKNFTKCDGLKNYIWMELDNGKWNIYILDCHINGIHIQTQNFAYTFINNCPQFCIYEAWFAFSFFVLWVGKIRLGVIFLLQIFYLKYNFE